MLLEKLKQQNPIVKFLLILFFTPNGFLVFASFGIAKMVASGMLPPVPIMLQMAKKSFIGLIIYALVKTIMSKMTASNRMMSEASEIN